MTKEDEARRLRDLKVTSIGLIVSLLTGLIVVSLRYVPVYLGATISARTATGETLVALLWSLAWAAAGFLFGFLFGIPKSPQGNQNASNAVGQTPPKLSVNTNLEEISDWLTKLIVGATLTQLVKMPAYISAAAHFIARGVGGDNATSFAASILVYFSCVGFLCGYILTRIFLSGAFALADGALQPPTIATLRSASLPGSDGGQNNAAVQQSAAEAATVPISADLSADEANAVARGALIQKDPGRAIQAASVAINKDPKDPSNQLVYGVALSWLNAGTPLVLDRLKKAHDLMPADMDAKAREDMFNTLVYTALYQDPPDGFNAAIQYGVEFTGKTSPTKTSLWINLACAYGQKYTWLKTRLPVDAEAVADTVNKAVEAINKALAIDTASKLRFQQLADPTGFDNDLSDLVKENAVVRSLIGMSGGQGNLGA